MTDASIIVPYAMGVFCGTSAFAFGGFALWLLPAFGDVPGAFYQGALVMLAALMLPLGAFYAYARVTVAEADAA